MIAFILVFLLVEETKRRSLEDLDLVFAVRKREFMGYQVKTYLPWFFRHYILRRREAKPSLYIDKIWGTTAATSKTPAPRRGTVDAECGGINGIGFDIPMSAVPRPGYHQREVDTDSVLSSADSSISSVDSIHR